MGKLIHPERFKSDDEMYHWISGGCAEYGVPRHIFIRWVIQDAMKRQLEANRKWFSGSSEIPEVHAGSRGVKPGPAKCDHCGGERRTA